VIERVIAAAEAAKQQYYHLVLLVGQRGSGKTKALQEAAARLEAPYVNIGLELSRRLLDMGAAQRRLDVRRLLEELLRDTKADVVVLDNTDVLFTLSLQQNALQLLKMLSRSTTLVAAWTGTLSQGYVTRGEPGHSEYVRERVDDFSAISVAGGDGEPSTIGPQEV
jgi:hypothetical protein